MRFLNKSLDPITITQYLVIGGLVSIAISPPLANLFIGLSFIATLSITTLRNQLLDFFKTKLGYACIAFILVLFSGLIYGIEANNVIASSIWGWRKFLMLPIAAAVFMNAPHAKQNLINCFWFVCMILAIYSYAIYLHPSFSTKHLGGITVRNYATQGLFFSVASIIAVANLLNSSLSKLQRAIYGASIFLFIFNIALIAIGRSGYVALILMVITFIYLQLEKVSLTKKIIICIIALLITSGTLFNTETSRARIDLAKQEYISGQNSDENTSIGMRLSFWKNTIEMLPNNIWLGVGTGGFEKAYASQVERKLGVAGTITGDPHNQYLKLIIEHGLLGLSVFFSILILLFNQHATNPFRAIGISLLLAISTTSLFNSHFSTFNEGQFFWILAGALFAAERFDPRIKT